MDVAEDCGQNAGSGARLACIFVSHLASLLLAGSVTEGALEASFLSVGL